MNGYVIKSTKAGEEEIRLINQYTRKPVTPDEVYTFTVTLCDNDADRDFEAFDAEGIEILAGMFLGKTGIFDHDRSSRSQTARIYKTWVEKEPGRRNCFGEDYVRLAAEAYIPRSEESRDVINRIDAGILKEVSVGCSVSRSLCGICGKEKCAHIKGREYGGAVCVRILKEPTDAYEFSFVAVPAQRCAGVTKAFKGDKEEDENVTEKLKNLRAGEDITLSFQEAGELKEAAMWGRAYKDRLSGSVKKYSRIIQPSLSEKVLEAITFGLGISELEEMEETYRKMALDALPLEPQLGAKSAEPADMGEFRI